ncbi:MAG: pseudouridine synthase [Geobacteraceae bacterium GWC2_58_44]|nr:MAG: pseudouridine synthase [Geobacteraceae bacterium GWC2_58_44]HBG07186.1 pseudouridine synthase [Geobacter sp.]
MALSPYPATVTMPKVAKPYPSVLDFLCLRFPKIERSSWERRIAEGKVLGEDGSPITSVSEYAPQKRIFYFREVEHEAPIPFPEQILFQNQDFLVSCKPHFLPVTPGGAYVDECLLHRLRKSTGNDDLVPMHRIDRETAGIVLFSANKRTRVQYCELFRTGKVEKTYHAISAGSVDPEKRAWLVENRMVPGAPWFRMETAAGPANARSRIELVETKQGMSRFLLTPLTGKTHQLRLHMSGLGFGILNDRYYPELQPQGPDAFDSPLQLLAKAVKFQDPVTGKQMGFESERKLLW